MSISSLTNSALLALLTPERQDELLKLLLKTKSYWIVIRESEDYCGITTVHTSIKDAVASCRDDIIDKNKTVGYSKEAIYDQLIKDMCWLTRYDRIQSCDYDWTIYEFPVHKMKTNNVLN